MKRSITMLIVLAFTLSMKAQHPSKFTDMEMQNHKMQFTDSTVYFVSDSGQVTNAGNIIYELGTEIKNAHTGKILGYLKYHDAPKVEKEMMPSTGNVWNEYYYTVENAQHKPLYKLVQKSGKQESFSHFDIFKLEGYKWLPVGISEWARPSKYNPGWGKVSIRSGEIVAMTINVKAEYAAVLYFLLK